MSSEVAFFNEMRNMRDYFKQVSFWQYTSHVSATAVTLKSVNKHRSLLSTILFLTCG